MKLAAGVLGIGLIIGGAAWIYPPAGMLLAGLFFLKAYVNLGKGKDAGKGQ